MKSFVSFSIYLIGILSLMLQMSCSPESVGFALPEGDIAAGKKAFAELNCTQCHSINGLEWKGDENSGDLRVPLGGEVSTIKTYGELVTSIINPSHKIARVYQQETATPDGASKMRTYNDVMTVQDLVDLVTFLRSEYQIAQPPYAFH